METISGNPHQKYILECCVDSVESALQAEKGGADRLELCSNLIIGGTTPTLALFRQIREHTNIRIHVLVRPRFGDFLYTKQELHIIAKEIDMFRKAGAEGRKRRSRKSFCLCMNGSTKGCVRVIPAET